MTLILLREDALPVRTLKVLQYGASPIHPETLRRAAKVHSVAALQSEYSLWHREVETNGVLATCRELGVTFVPYSPLGRGFLTGAIQKLDDLDAAAATGQRHHGRISRQPRKMDEFGSVLHVYWTARSIK